MERARVLLVDDHALLRSGVGAILRSQPDFEVIAEAISGEEAVEKAAELLPDLIMMDLYMPGISGIEATRRITAAHPSIRVVMLTFSEEDQDLFEAIKAGACGYILKKTDVDAFLRTVRSAYHRESVLSGRTAGLILREFSRLSAPPPAAAAPTDSLSPRELDVLGCLSRGESNKEIAASLSVSENTVKNHLKRILEKLHLQNRVQAATYAVQTGLRQSPHV